MSNLKKKSKNNKIDKNEKKLTGRKVGKGTEKKY